MLKITIERDGKKLTLFVADNAFAREENIPQSTQATILRIIAEKMFAAAADNGVVYLARIDLPKADADQDHIMINYDSSANDKGRLLNGRIQNVRLSDVAYTYSSEDLGENPPINIEDSYDVTESVDKYPAYRKLLLETGACTEEEVDDLVIIMLGDPRSNPPGDSLAALNYIRNAALGELPPNISADFRADLDRQDVSTKVLANSINKEKTTITASIDSLLESEYEYHLVIDPLAATLYNAAKDYYIELWKTNRGNYAKLAKEREAFNILFQGIAQINPDFSITSVDAAVSHFRLLDINLTQKTISDLLGHSYKTNQTAFHHLQGRLANTQNNFYEVIGKYIPWTYQFQFKAPANNAYERYQQANRDTADLPQSAARQLTLTLKMARKEIRDRYTFIVNEHAIKSDQDSGPVKKESSFWQRNKATLIGIGIGVLVAAAAAAAAVAVATFVFLLPITLPIALGIAGGAVLILGISTLIGRVIDSSRNAQNQKDQFSDVARTSVEEESLLGNPDHNFRPAAAPVKTLPSESRKSPQSQRTSTSVAAFTPTIGNNNNVSNLPNPKLVFESELVRQFARKYSAADSNPFNTLEDDIKKKFRTACGSNMDRFLQLVNTSYNSNEKGQQIIASTLEEMASRYQDIDLDLFNGSTLEKDYNLRNLLVAGRRQDNSPGL